MMKHAHRGFFSVISDPQSNNFFLDRNFLTSPRLVIHFCRLDSTRWNARKVKFLKRHGIVSIIKTKRERFPRSIRCPTERLRSPNQEMHAFFLSHDQQNSSVPFKISISISPGDAGRSIAFNFILQFQSMAHSILRLVFYDRSNFKIWASNHPSQRI